MRSSRAGPLTSAVLAIAAATTAHAQSARRVRLGPDMSAERALARCGRARCFTWRPEGFGMSGLPGIVYDFAATRTGRIVAATSLGLWFSDDRGATWQPAPRVGGLAFAVAFDARSDFGVAVGNNGYVWTSEDGGATWRNRRDDTGVLLVRVGVIGRTVVMISQGGGVWISTDGGISIRVLIDPPATTIADERTMVVSSDAIWVADDHGNWQRIDADGLVTTVSGRSE